VRDLALAVGRQEGSDVRGHHLDPTRVSLPGAYGPDRDEHARTSPPGDAQDPRPAWHPAVMARMVWPDGGVPWVRPRWEGNPDATSLVQA
jgi:hypothetical protein